MTQKRRRAVRGVAAFASLLALGLLFCLTPVGVPASSRFQPSIAEIRAFASQSDHGGGALPTELRSLQVGESRAPRLLVVPGASLAANTFTACAYQVVYPDRTIILDAVNDAELQAKQGFPGGQIFPEPYARMQDAMRRAARIVATHEHFDHVGGISRSPYFDEIAPRVALTEEQLHNPELLTQAGFTAAQRDRLTPLRYERMVELAPGVVLIKAPGHTPGTQMVYVRLGNGSEFLLVGDIAWSMDNIRLPRMHVRAFNWIVGEDAEAMGQELRYLHDLTEAEPQLHLIVAHDGAQRADYVQRGLVQDGLR